MNKLLLCVVVFCVVVFFLANINIIRVDEVEVKKNIDIQSKTENIDIQSKTEKIDLEISEVRSRKGVKDKNTAVYFTITNNSAEDIVITGAGASDIAINVELHDVVTNKNGVVEMKKLDKLLVPKGSIVKFKPRSLHIMLMNLKKDLIVDETFTMTLNTDKGPKELLVTIKQDVISK
jgi:copper(I)-binding protein